MLVTLGALGLGLDARAWRGAPGDLPPYPEMSLPELTSRGSNAVCFSGGGSRAYSAALGQMKALLDLGVIDNVRYLNGISGGAWAASVISYAPESYAATDSDLLGDVTPPEALNLTALNQLSPNARAAATIDFEAVLKKNAVFKGLAGGWQTAVGEIFLSAHGIDPAAYPAWKSESVKELLGRNPGLGEQKFLATRPGRPFPVIGVTLMGPAQSLPFEMSKRSYRMYEYTPLYAGTGVALNETYTEVGVFGSSIPINRQIGGFVEPWAAGAPDGAQTPLRPSGTLEVAAPGAMTFGAAVSASSYFVADPLAVVTRLSSLLTMRDPSWPVVLPGETPQGPPVGETPDQWVFGDGGILDNQNLLGMLQRRVENIVIFINTDVVLAPVEVWDPAERDPTMEEIDDSIPAYFGIEVDNATKAGFFMIRNTIFPRSDFVKVVRALQEAQAKGRGAVVTTPLTTVANPVWKIPAGVETKITWVYTARAREWEKQLPQEVAKLAVSHADPQGNNISALPEDGPLASFPFYKLAWYLTPIQANMLADFSGWVVKENKETLVAALGKQESRVLI